MTVQMSYAGGAPQLGLTGNIGAADSSFVASTGGTASGYPDGSLGDFVVLIGSGEKVLCSARSGTTFTVALGGRGYDGTSAAAWNAGATVEHVWDATSAQAASDHVNDKVHTHAFTDVANTFTAASQNVVGTSTGTVPFYVNAPAGHATSIVDLAVDGTVKYRVNASAQVFALGTDHYFGANAFGGAGTRLHIGSLGDASNAYVVSEGSGSSTGLVLKSAGPADVTVQDGAGVSLASFLHSAAVTTTGFTDLLIRYIASGGAQLSQVTCAAEDSAGAGFRSLRVPN